MFRHYFFHWSLNPPSSKEQLAEAFFNRYDLVSCKTCEMQQSIYYFFTGKSTEKASANCSLDDGGFNDQ
jgi:hypothetical protein